MFISLIINRVNLAGKQCFQCLRFTSIWNLCVCTKCFDVSTMCVSREDYKFQPQMNMVLFIVVHLRTISYLKAVVVRREKDILVLMLQEPVFVHNPLFLISSIPILNAWKSSITHPWVMIVFVRLENVEDEGLLQEIDGCWKRLASSLHTLRNKLQQTFSGTTIAPYIRRSVVPATDHVF